MFDLNSSVEHEEPKKKMLTRLWAALTSGLKTEDLSSLHVTQWQNHKKVLLIYLLWRWISAIVFLAIIVCSSIDIGRDKSEVKHENHDTKWWIYLTNWTILLCMVQAWLAALIVTKALMDNNRDYEFTVQTKVGKVQQFYWATYSSATVFSFIVTFLYWTSVYDSATDSVDVLNIMVHGAMALFMFGDLLIVGHPVRMDPDLYFSTGVGLGYSIFTLVYYIGEGTSRTLDHAIYPLVDWKKPGKTIVVCVGGIFFTVLVHIFVCCVCKVRYLIHKKLFAKKNKKLETCKEHARMLSENKDFTVSTIVDLK